MKKIYLAGPDVFLPEAKAKLRGKELKALCAKYGFVGLYPLDNEIPELVRGGPFVAAWIAGANMRMIEQADIVLANLNDWQGEPDSGTAFEVGYARALGKEIWGYRDRLGGLCAWEPFGGPVNLMLWANVTFTWGNAEDCLLQLSESL